MQKKNWFRSSIHLVTLLVLVGRIGNTRAHERNIISSNFGRRTRARARSQRTGSAIKRELYGKGGKGSTEGTGGKGWQIWGKGGKGGSGGKGYNGKGKGYSYSNSGNDTSGYVEVTDDQVHVDGEYLGCLALSADEISEFDASIDCDYVIHYTDTTRDSENGDGSNEGANDDVESSESDSGVEGYQASNGYGTTQAETDLVVSSIDGNFDPYDAFEVTLCDTYEHLWIFDIVMSCGNRVESWDCHCTYAEALMEKGLLSCDDAIDCPSECPICSNCLQYIGCDNVPGGFVIAAGSDSSGIAVGLTLVALVVLVASYWKFMRGKRSKGDLNTNLMEDGTRASQKEVWMVPEEKGVPAEAVSSQKHVWLIPQDGGSSSGRNRGTKTFIDVVDYYPARTLAKASSNERNMVQGRAIASRHGQRTGVSRVQTDMTGRGSSTADSMSNNRNRVWFARLRNPTSSPLDSQLSVISDDPSSDLSNVSSNLNEKGATEYHGRNFVITNMPQRK